MNDEARQAEGLPDTYAGYLEKKGKLKNGTWKKRYFALRGHHLLCFQDGEAARPVLASIDVVKVEVCGPDANDDASIFNLKVLEGSIKLRAPNAATRGEWERVLLDAQRESLDECRRARSEEREKRVREAYIERKAHDEGGRQASSSQQAAGEDDGATAQGPQSPPQGAAASSSRRAANSSEASRSSKYRVNTAGNDMLNMLASAGYAASVRHTLTTTERTKEGVCATSGAQRPSLNRARTTCDDPGPRAGSLARSMSAAAPAQQRQRRSSNGSADLASLDWEWGEPEAERWILDVLGLEARPEAHEDLWAWLHDGTVLCQLASRLKPNALRAKKIHTQSKLPFMMLENISTFLAVCRDEFGVESRSLFESLDLFDRKGPQQVLFCLNALRRRAAALADEPVPAPNGASPAAPARSTSSVSSLGDAPPQSPRPDEPAGETPKTTASKNAAVPSMFARKAATVDVDPTYVPTHQTAAASQKQTGDDAIISDGFATVVAEHDAADADELTVFIGDVVNVKLARGGWCFAEENEGWVLVQKGGEQGLVPAACLKPGISEESHFKAGGGRGSSALDRELKAKAAAKYDPIAEALAQHWIEQVTGHVFRKPFAEELKDGVVLCRLVNEIKPGSVAKIYEGAKAFGQMDNISNFLKAVKKLGVLSRDTFETTDLFEMRDLNLVVQCLFALSKAIVKAAPDWSGPFLTGHDAGFSEAVMSNLKVIIAVSEHRDRHRHFAAAAAAADDDAAARRGVDEDVVSEAVEYRLAMLGLRDSQVAGANVHGVDRAALEPSFLVVWSSSTKSTLAMETNERRLVQLLAAKKKRFEMVYVDVSPERKIELSLICQNKDVDLPALTFGSDYHGPYEKIQELEDDGQLDDLLAPAPDGEGFWALPEAWGVQSSLLEGGGMRVINEVPAL
mmetsp:Transcript_20105/g.63223  ORF Transcript_20105/g.63223 Transcript_20105/m.63223 type:complete len:912 (+) Transcript_20105:254-2989(+)